MKIALPRLATAVLFAIAPLAKANLITNGSFEIVSPTLSANGICSSPASGYPYPACTATGWSGIYQIGRGTTTGIGGSSFNIPQPDPDGSQALILQGSGANATQSVSVATSGEYALTFWAANRSTPGLNGPENIEVLLDGVVVSGGTFKSLPTAWTEEALSLNLNAATYSLEIEGLGTGGDTTAFVDDVSLVAAQANSSVPEPSSLLLAACGAIATLALFRRRLKATRQY